ncbi:MAG: hypothetical protein ACJASQ_002712 [Crocinitomicaceae bacterium]|jgi:hypothetical protein
MANSKSFFPHLVVGHAKKVSQDYISTNLIPYSGDPSTILNELITETGNGSTLTALKIIAKGHIDNNAVISSKSDLLAIFPDFHAFVESLSSYDGIDNTYTISLDPSIQSELPNIWDAVFIHYIDNQNPSLLFDLITAVKVISLSTSSMIGTPIKDWWQKSRLLFPNPPFPLPKSNELNELGDSPTTVDVLNTSSRKSSEESLQVFGDIESLESAHKELICIYQDQIQRQKLLKIDEASFNKVMGETTEEDFDKDSKGEDFDPVAAYADYTVARNGEELDTDSMANMSDSTSSTLKHIGINEDLINIPYALKRISKAINGLVQKYQFIPAQSQLAVIGESILTIDQAVYGDIICLEDNALTHCELLHKLSANIPDRDYVQILGMGHANVIRQKIVRHEADEIAHIENVLQGEHKEKTHRNLKIKEEFTFSESERNEETETDSKSTSRFELSKETNKVAEENQQFEAGVGISAGMGTVSINANVGFASGSSSSETSASSVKLSKELTERAVNRIQERSLEIRESRSINEVEVTNTHGIDNAAGTDHINGFYYWVDKVYENQVFNVGKRLMLEFMIPEPAAHHIFSAIRGNKEGVTITKPIHPSEYTGSGIAFPLRSFNDITRTNYQIWAAKYDSQNITPAPTELATIANSYSLDYLPGGKTWNDFSFKDLTVPEGYEAHKGRMSIATSHGSNRYISGFLGNQAFQVNGTTVAPIELTLNQETDIVPLAFRGNFSEYAMTVEVICQLSDAGYDKWRIETYNAILGAYEAKKIDYDSQLAQMETAVSIKGQNPRLNRETEKTELKKWALELLTLQRFDGFDAMKKAKNGAPEIDFEESIVEGQFVKFFEQSIEWHNMTYLFYPYFWAHKQRWSVLKQLNDTDETFTKFLQAGYARVVVPVHPKFTEAILHYLNSGEIWNGQELPAIDDEMYLSITQEIKEMEDNTDGEEVGEAWETRVPTNLVMITSDIPTNLPGS